MSKCARCNGEGAGSKYNGESYHMTCKMEQKLDDGLISADTPVMKEPRKPK